MANVFGFLEVNQGFIFQIFIAALVFLAGLIISKIVSKIIQKFLNKIRLNQVTKRLGWEEAFARVDIKLDLVQFFGEISKWMILIVFLMMFFEVLGLLQFSQFLGRIVDYFPNILVASIIFIATLYSVDFTYRTFFVTAKKTKLTYSRFFGVGVRRAIWVLAGLTILYQLKIVPNLILSIFIAILALIVIACGIAFGLGGKEIAKKILEEWKGKLP